MSRFGGKRFAFVQNKNLIGDPSAPFTPTFAFDESIGNANLTYTCNLSTNLPNTTIKYNIGGTIDDAEFLTGSIRTQNIVLDSNGNATISFTANTAISSDSRTFRVEISSPGSNVVLANTNFHTISGNLSNSIQFIPTGSNTYQQSEITVGPTVYTLYEFNANVGTQYANSSGIDALQTYDVSSVLADGPTLDILCVGGGGSASTAKTFINANNGGGGGGQVSSYFNITVPNSVYTFSVGAGGIANAQVDGGKTSIDYNANLTQTANIAGYGGKRGSLGPSANIGGAGGAGGGYFFGDAGATGNDSNFTLSVRNGGGGGAGWGANANGQRGLSTGSDAPYPRANIQPGDGTDGINTIVAGSGGDGFDSNVTGNIITYGAGGGALRPSGAGGGGGLPPYGGRGEVAVMYGSGSTASGIDEVRFLNTNIDLTTVPASYIKLGYFSDFPPGGNGLLKFNYAITNTQFTLKANTSSIYNDNEIYTDLNYSAPSQTGDIGEITGTRLVGGNWYAPPPIDGNGWGNFGSGGNIHINVDSIAGKGHDGVIYIRHPKNGDRKLSL